MNKKILTVAILATIGFGANAHTIYENGNSKLNLSGDLELDTTLREKQSFGGGDDGDLNSGGRVLLQLDGQHLTDAGHFAGFKVQPLIKLDGTTAVDDAYFEIGAQNTWGFRIGRFEPYNMFPLGQDTVLEHAGGTSDLAPSFLNKDGGNNYIYQMKAGRERSKEGQAMLTYQSGNAFAEVAVTMDAVTSDDGKSSEEGIVRPVLGYKAGNTTFSVGAEMMTTGNDMADDFLGYGATVNHKTAQGLDLNLSYAGASVDKEGYDIDLMTVGANANYNGAFLGYIYSDNEANIGDITTHSFYASYLIDQPLEIKNMDVYLGGYYSMAEGTTRFGSEEIDDMGARLRVKYFF